MKFTEEQVQNFNQEILPLTERELVLIAEWIAANLKPEEVYTRDQIHNAYFASVESGAEMIMSKMNTSKLPK